MIRNDALRGTVSHIALTAGLTLLVSLAAQPQAAAQAPAAPAPDQPAAPPGAIALPQISVPGAQPPNTLQRDTSLDRLPGTIQSTPQTLNVITREVMEQQNTTTLDQALRNVPGITASIGEGGGGMNGDQFRIRGFEARNDIYVDGLRDFGVYTRDSFNYETVTVLKGPSGLLFGGGNIGGAINVSTRVPHLGNSYSGQLSAGSGPLFRGTADVNYQIGPTAAVRLNIMGHRAEVVGRDEVRSNRWGIAPSFAMGLGTDTTFTINYVHQRDERVPDYGVPVILAPGLATSRPITEFGIDRANWYGFSTDLDDVNVDMATARLRHVATDWLTLNNDTRLGVYSRSFAATPVSCAAACVALLFGRNPATATAAVGGPGPFNQDLWSVQNITTATARFTTGFMRHEALAGVDWWYVRDRRTSFAYAPARPAQNVLDPSPRAPYFIVANTTATAERVTEQSAVGLFVSDRIWFHPTVSIIAGVRWNWYDTDTSTFGRVPPVVNISSTPSTVDPRVSLVFEPTQFQTYYFSYSQSSTPPGLFVSNAPTPLAANTSALDPERNTIYELGVKYGLLGGRLGLYASLFRIEKANARETDPLTGDIVQSGDAQRNQGIELGVTGRITDAWEINANYIYLDSETTASTTAANVGRRVQFVPRHAAALWTTYEFFRGTRTNVTVGAGITFRSGAYLNPANTAEVPANFSLDALVSHQLGANWRLAINGYNLTDRLNYDALFAGRVAPAPGRTVIVSAAASF